LLLFQFIAVFDVAAHLRGYLTPGKK